MTRNALACGCIARHYDDGTIDVEPCEVHECKSCGGTMDEFSQYGELKGICPNPKCDVVVELGPDPEW